MVLPAATGGGCGKLAEWAVVDGGASAERAVADGGGAAERAAADEDEAAAAQGARVVRDGVRGAAVDWADGAAWTDGG